MVSSLELVTASPRRRADENPPPYAGENAKIEPTAGPEAADFDAPPVTAPQLVPDIPRCNLLNISRPEGRIAGQYVVDPSLQVSDALLAPLLPEERSSGARPNLRLATNKAVEAEVWVLDSRASAVRLVFISKLAHVRLRLVSTTRPRERMTRQVDSARMPHSLGNTPCFVEVRAAGNATVALPRDFVGTVLTSTTRGPATIPARFATLSEVEGDGKYFRGPMSRVGASGWHGTSVNIEAPLGKITVLHSGDPEPPNCIVS